eukprot:351590-Chlamydomonas_euryale.AAC.4
MPREPEPPSPPIQPPPPPADRTVAVALMVLDPNFSEMQANGLVEQFQDDVCGILKTATGAAACDVYALQPGQAGMGIAMGVNLYASSPGAVLPMYVAMDEVLRDTRKAFHQAFLSEYNSYIVYGNLLTRMAIPPPPNPSPPPPPPAIPDLDPKTNVPQQPQLSIPVPVPGPPATGDKGVNTALVAALSVLAVLAVAAVGAACFLWYRMEKGRDRVQDDFHTPMHDQDDDDDDEHAAMSLKVRGRPMPLWGLWGLCRVVRLGEARAGLVVHMSLT